MDYKEYSLEQLSNFLHDAMSTAEATPQEIYDTIRKVVEENYYTYKHQTSKAYELLALLNGKGKGHIKAYDDAVDKVLSCDKDDPSPKCQGAWNDFWEDTDTNREYSLREAEYYNKSLESEIEEVRKNGGYEWTPISPKDKVMKWQLPVEVDGASGEYFIMFPDDLMEAANLKEGDWIEWVDRGDGSYLLKKRGD